MEPTNILVKMQEALAIDLVEFEDSVNINKLKKIEEVYQVVWDMLHDINKKDSKWEQVILSMNIKRRAK